MFIRVNDKDYRLDFSHEPSSERPWCKRIDGAAGVPWYPSPKMVSTCNIYEGPFRTKKGTLCKRLKRVGHGEALCHPSDSFVKALGRKLAFQRALCDMAEAPGRDERRAFWTAFWAAEKHAKAYSAGVVLDDNPRPNDGFYLPR